MFAGRQVIARADEIIDLPAARVKVAKRSVGNRGIDSLRRRPICAIYV
jgi:hypothetical protein